MISYFRYKGSLQGCEDSLTSLVFDRLKYLPVDIFWKILKDSLYCDKLPATCSEVESFSFWEHWNSEGTTNKHFVEPDIFIRFEQWDIIVEAKRYNENQQSRDQMRNEIIAYYNEYKDDCKSLYFIQLGGLLHTDDENNFEENGLCAVICKTNWSRILEQVYTESQNHKKQATSDSLAISRILDDVVFGMRLHQYYKLSWLSEMEPISIHYQFPLQLFDYAK